MEVNGGMLCAVTLQNILCTPEEKRNFFHFWLGYPFKFFLRFNNKKVSVLHLQSPFMEQKNFQQYVYETCAWASSLRVTWSGQKGSGDSK